MDEFSEDLGAVDFVFSDKTGTLTDNILSLRVCSIGTKNYGTYRSNCIVRMGGSTPAGPGFEQTGGVGSTVDC